MWRKSGELCMHCGWCSVASAIVSLIRSSFLYVWIVYAHEIKKTNEINFPYNILFAGDCSSSCGCSSRIAHTDSNINLEFQQAKHLIDGGFVFIRRYENSSVLIKDFDKLADKYADCFYRNENSALDVCDGNIVSVGRIECDFLILRMVNGMRP